MPPLSVLMTTEGTYPYGAGGVSTWCDALIRNTPDVRYVLLPIMMNPHIERKFEPLANIRRIVPVPLWGIEEPSEFRSGTPFAELYERKRGTSEDDVAREFVPLFRRFLDCVNEAGVDPAAFGRVLLEMESYFRRRDYNETMKSAPVWEVFRSTMEAFSERIVHASVLPG